MKALCVLSASTILLEVGVPAAAQGSNPGNVSFGYQFTHVNGPNGGDGVNVPKGWTASVTGHVNPFANVVGEVNGAYKDGASRHDILGGVRVGGGRGANEAVIFWQFLTGLSHTSGSNGWVLQPGIGMDIRGRGSVSARFNFDYRASRADGFTQKGFRVAAGLVIDFKRR